MKRLGIFCLVFLMVVGCLPVYAGAVDLNIPAKAADQLIGGLKEGLGIGTGSKSRKRMLLPKSSNIMDS